MQKEGSTKEKGMILSPFWRKRFLILHLVSTMLWLGAAASYIPIAIYVLTHTEADMIRSGIQIMTLVVNGIVVPVAIIALLTGIVLSLGTRWGLSRHYWVFIKLLLTVFAVSMLLSYALDLNSVSGIAAQATLSSADLALLQDPSHLSHPIGSVIIVLTATFLSVYKPKGMTKFGRRKQVVS